MKKKISTFLFFAKQNIEITALVFSLILLILLTQSYNSLKNIKKKNFYNILQNIYFEKTLNFYFENLSPKYISINHRITPGETLEKILVNYGISTKEIRNIKKILKKTNSIQNLKVNLIIKLTIDKTDEKVIEFIFPISRTKKIQLVRKSNKDLFEVKEIITNLNKKTVLKEGMISQSLYKSATDAGVKPNMIIEFARIYGFQVDFQRDIKKNDYYQIVYEVYQDDDGKVYEHGNILYANLVLQGQQNPLYYFSEKNNSGHYDASGKSIQKALMKTPINGARLSSSFGMRKHPISGFNKMHRGTDFAAPKGTAIMASGNGVVTSAKWCGGGGNCIKIKHNSTYTTIYAHMSKFANGIKAGTRVKQGRIIGYVGSTGMSTGPHLHYEVVVNGKKVNSQNLKLPSGKILSGKTRKLFEINRIKTDVLISELVVNQS
jgi:murein DD-endopeptidase MepM/ murein hydrolase activator NlpD